jgi:hydroxyacylglutathione hydrolase
LHLQDVAAFVASLDRLVAFAGSRPVTHVLGCHIEMRRTPGRDCPIGSTYQPDESVPQMTVDQFVVVRDAAAAVADAPGVHVLDDFIIYNGPCSRTMPKQAARALRSRLATASPQPAPRFCTADRRAALGRLSGQPRLPAGGDLAR